MGIFSKIIKNAAEVISSGYDDVPDYSGSCPDCPSCGTTMGYSYSNSEFKCPACGYLMDEQDWDYDDGDENGMPFVCSTCGGPWPSCQTSCKMFDD